MISSDPTAESITLAGLLMSDTTNQLLLLSSFFAMIFMTVVAQVEWWQNVFIFCAIVNLLL